MVALTLRAVKGSELTHTEVDDNFSNLNTGKADALQQAEANERAWIRRLHDEDDFFLLAA